MVTFVYGQHGCRLTALPTCKKCMHPSSFRRLISTSEVYSCSLHEGVRSIATFLSTCQLSAQLSNRLHVNNWRWFPDHRQKKKNKFPGILPIVGLCMVFDSTCAGVTVSETIVTCMRPHYILHHCEAYLHLATQPKPSLLISTL